MFKRVTMVEVAKEAKVSKSTVSQYLNGRYDFMSEKTKERIRIAIDTLGYQPNYVARSLKQKSTSTIGVIVANILHAFSTQVIRAIEDICNANDFHVIVCNADDDPNKERKYIDMLSAKQVDGMIVFPTGGNVDLYKKLVKENYPLIFIDRIVEDLHVDTILLDNYAASTLAVEHFLSKGYKKLAFLTTSLIRNITPRVERANGFKEALLKSGLEVNNEYIKGLDLREIPNGLHKMLTLKDPPQAILAGNDLALMQILQYTKQHNIKVPDGLALIGIDDVSFASIFNPTLTTISQPTFKMGKQAAELLLQKIANRDMETEGEVHRYNPTLVKRGSC